MCRLSVHQGALLVAKHGPMRADPNKWWFSLAESLALENDMVRNGEFGIDDVRRVVQRYWWILPMCVVVFGAVGFSIATLLPKRYTSQTLVLVAKPTVPTEYEIGRAHV